MVEKNLIEMYQIDFKGENAEIEAILANMRDSEKNPYHKLWT